MKLVMFWGCKLTFFLEQYKSATRAVLNHFGFELIEPEFACCGYPVRGLDFDSYITTAVRNLAVARKQGDVLVTPCKCCFGNLKYADHLLQKKPRFRNDMNRLLSRDNLEWQKGLEIKHLLSVLAEDVSLEKISAAVQLEYQGLKAAASYGCHALRPSNITRFDDPLNPAIFEKLIEVTGVRCVDWPRRLECCGYPIKVRNENLALAFMDKKLLDARRAGAHFICTACTYCQFQFDKVQVSTSDRDWAPEKMPAILYPQLLGLSLGLDERDLGLDRNQLQLEGLKDFLHQPDVSPNGSDQPEPKARLEA